MTGGVPYGVPLNHPFIDGNATISGIWGTPKSSILIAFSLINQPFWGPFVETTISMEFQGRFLQNLK